MKGKARKKHEVYEDSLNTCGVRKAGVEALGLWALEQFGLDRLLRSLSNQTALVNLALASIVMRLSEPGVYCLRTNLTGQGDDWLCETYTLLTDRV